MATIDDILGSRTSSGTQAGSASQTPKLSIPEQETVTIAPQKMKVSQGIMVPGGKQKDGNAGQPGVRPLRLSYEEMFKLANPNPIPSQGQLAAEKRKQKRQQVFAALGDGISALSNLYFTSQYAPNMFSAGKSYTSRLNDRYERLEKERQKNIRAYIDGLSRARQADDAYNDNQRQWERIIGLDKAKADRDKKEEERAAAMHELDVQLKNNAIDEAQYNAAAAEVEARYAEAQQQADLKRKGAQAGASNAAAQASRARARQYGSGGNGRGKKNISLQIGDRTYNYKTKEDYERAVYRYAKQYGISLGTKISKSGQYGLPEWEMQYKPIEQLAAEVETAAATRPDLSRYNRSNGSHTPPLDK